MSLAAALRKARIDAGLTVKTVCKDMRMSRTHLTALEYGEMNPKPQTVEKLERYYGMEIAK